MRPIRNRAKPLLRRRAPSAPGPGRALPGASRSPVGAARPDAHARPRSARCLGPDPRAHLGQPHARCVSPSPQVRSHPSLGLAAQRGRKAREAAVTTEDSLGAVWRGAACTCAPVGTRGSGCVRAALSSAAQPCGPRGLIEERGYPAGPGLGWDAQGIPAPPRALRPSRSVRAVWSTPALGPLAGPALSDPTAVISHCCSRPPKPSTSAAQAEETTQSPRAAERVGHPVPRPETPLPSFLPVRLQRWRPKTGLSPPRPPRVRPAALTGSCRWTGSERSAGNTRRGARRAETAGAWWAGAPGRAWRAPRAARLGQLRPGSPRPSPRWGGDTRR